MPTARLWWHTPAQSSTCPRDDHRAISQDACSIKYTPSFDGYYSLSYALPRMTNLRGFFVNVVQVPHIAEAVTIIVSLVFLLWVAKRGRGIDRRYQFALAVACSVLVSYHLFVYDLSILLIPMMAALGLEGQRNSTVAKIAVLIPLLGVPIGLVSRPFLLAVPLLAFLLSLTRAFDVSGAIAVDRIFRCARLCLVSVAGPVAQYSRLTYLRPSTAITSGSRSCQQGGA